MIIYHYIIYILLYNNNDIQFLDYIYNEKDIYIIFLIVLNIYVMKMMYIYYIYTCNENDVYY